MLRLSFFLDRDRKITGLIDDGKITEEHHLFYWGGWGRGCGGHTGLRFIIYFLRRSFLSFFFIVCCD